MCVCVCVMCSVYIYIYVCILQENSHHHQNLVAGDWAPVGSERTAIAIFHTSKISHIYSQVATSLDHCHPYNLLAPLN